MSAPPYMPFYVGDYLADTTHLTCTEHGAYTLLLMTMWRAGGSLPSDPAKLARFARCTPAQWARMSDTIMSFFDAADGTITQRRLQSEMTKHSVAVKRQHELSSNGGKAKALKTKGTHVPHGTFSECQPEPEPKVREETTVSLLPVTPTKRRSRMCPSDWAPSPADLAVGAGEGLTPGEIERELAKFRDHEFRDPHSQWSPTFRKWLRTAAERKPANVRTGHPPAASSRAAGRGIWAEIAAKERAAGVG